LVGSGFQPAPGAIAHYGDADLTARGEADARSSWQIRILRAASGLQDEAGRHPSAAARGYG